jgi:hypothetical protein
MILVPRFLRHRRGDAVVERRRQLGRYASIIVVAEGAMPIEGTMAMPEYEVDEYGHAPGRYRVRVANELERRSGVEAARPRWAMSCAVAPRRDRAGHPLPAWRRPTWRRLASGARWWACRGM